MDTTTVISSSPTFCPAPWTSLNIDQAGEVSPCFHCVKMIGNIKKNTIQEVITGPVITEMKQAMSRGEWAPGCTWCRRLEETTGVSGRTVRRTSAETQAAIDTDPDFFKLEHLVVNWSNLCNLACVYCNPETSTAWQSVKKIPINHVKNEHADLIELARTQGHNIQGLSLGGGEPLLQKGLEQFLNYIDSSKVSVMITTNLSVDLDRNSIYQQLKTWPTVSWMISFDNANKEKFEYVRHGASWEQFVDNIQIMKRDRQKIQAHPAYSVYCALDLMEYYNFCAEQQLDIFWCELTNPWDLDIRRQSAKLRQLAVYEIDRVVAKYQNQKTLSTDVLERYRATLVDNSYLNNQDFVPDLLEWHNNIETTLKKTAKFVDLWPDIAKELDMKINPISQQINDVLPSPPPWHPGVRVSNSVLDWLPTDTKESFEKLMQNPAHQEYFSKLGWDKPGSITYAINSYGFRSEEFDIGSDCIVALGCSYTQGIGLPLHTLWPSIVGKHLGLKVYNLALGGASADTCFMLGQYWIPVLKPKLVVMAAPPQSRIDIISASKFPEMQTIMPGTTDGEFGNDNFIKHWFANERNQQLNNAKNKLAIKSLANNLGIPCLTYNAHDWFAKSREEVGYARDYMHAGPRGHEILAERIINDFTANK